MLYIINTTTNSMSRRPIYKITFNPTQIDIESTNFLRIIRPNQGDGCNIIVFAEMPDIPAECDINRARSVKFSQLSDVISYAVENKLFSIAPDKRIKVKLDAQIIRLFKGSGIIELDGSITF